jgi:GcvH upstream region-like protein
MTEESALKIWEDVTLFRRLLHEVGDAALVDPLSLGQFYAYAYENAQIELYQLPAECRLKSLADLELLETYLTAVGKKSAPLDIPQNYASLDEIEGKAPSLVGRHYTVYYAHTSKQALQSRVSIKEMVQWECDHWLELQKQFPELAQSQLSPFETLEQMDTGRKLIDAFARKQIVDSHPEWIEETLLTDQMVEKELFLSFDSSQKSLEGIKDVKKLATVLNEQNEVNGYTQDKNHFYRFLVKQKSENPEVLTYKEALKEGLLVKLAERLEGKALAEAVVNACPVGYREMAHAYRFAPFVVEHFATPATGSLAGQFKIEKLEKTIVRCEEDFIGLDKVLALESGQFSQVQVDPVQGAYLYRFLEKRKETTLPIEKMVKTQEILSKEARCKYFETLLANFEKQ